MSKQGYIGARFQFAGGKVPDDWDKPDKRRIRELERELTEARRIIADLLSIRGIGSEVRNQARAFLRKGE